MLSTKDYTVEIFHPKTVARLKELWDYFQHVGAQESALYGEVFKVDWERFDVLAYSRIGRVAVCRRKGKPVGVLLSRVGPSLFDSQVKILMQDLFYVERGTRAAKYLMDDFIDFGKANANYIVTMIAEKSNLRGRSLERLGFRKSEVHYWMEIKNG